MPLDTTNWPITETDETTALLIRARGFIERSWCRNAQARDGIGSSVSPLSERAVSWCAYGALAAFDRAIGTGMPGGDRSAPVGRTIADRRFGQ